MQRERSYWPAGSSLAGRIIIALFFGVMAGGMGHIANSKGMEAYARAMRFPIPAIAGWPTGLWLLAASISIGFGIWADVGALMLFGIFAGLGSALPFTITDPLFSF